MVLRGNVLSNPIVVTVVAAVTVVTVVAAVAVVTVTRNVGGLVGYVFDGTVNPRGV
jgi:hypothetical protein